MSQMISGSSPLARGLLVVLGGRPGGLRIIPARAGFTETILRRRKGGRDHPRSRGVYNSEKAVPRVDGGSSPLARGLRVSRWRKRSERRIIPARAGFTRNVVNCGGRLRDHPRSRGVYAESSRSYSHPSGSSPLARGLRLGNRLGRPDHGIIPARAGFTVQTTRKESLAQDHPRSRGVYQYQCGERDCHLGSSPLARGLPIRGLMYNVQFGIIPARAGFTLSWTFTDPRPPDHPRSRGVYALLGFSFRVGDGSSPLARGLPTGSPT